MTELDIYQKIMELCIAHKSSTEWKETHGFGVGYLDQLNTNNLEQSDFRKGLFYSEKWYKAGMNPNSMPIDFPMILMLPIAESGEIDKKGTVSGMKSYDCMIFVLDLLYRDRQGSDKTAYAKRSREQLWADTNQIGVELLQEFNKKYFADTPKIYIGNDGKYRGEKLYEFSNSRLAGTSFEFSIKVPGGCEKGTFDYEKDFPEKKEKFCQC
jgi:hypothetical protein